MLKVSGLPAGFADCDLEDFFRPHKIKLHVSKSDRAEGIAWVEMTDDGPDGDPVTATRELGQKKFKGQYSVKLEPDVALAGGSSSYVNTDPNDHQPESKKDPGSSTSGTTTRNDR